MRFPAKKYSVFFSAGIWILLGLLLLVFQPLSWGVKIPAVFIFKQLVHFLLMIGLYYVTAKIMVPRTLFRNHILLFVCWCIAATALALFVSGQINEHLHVFEAVSKSFGREMRPKPHGLDFFITTTTLLTLGVSTSVSSFARWQRDAQLRLELEKEKVKSELSFLKAQINPHFFFNTLNNIYALSFIDVTASQEALLKLSRMMRYLLYETQNDVTMLSKELTFIRDYIALMKLRMQDSAQLTYEEPVHYQDVPIAPMLLLPYVENAFKHGLSTAGLTEIQIALTYSNGQLDMVVVNKIHRTAVKDAIYEEHSGIGMQNTLRRLQLLYPDKYDLAIKEIADGAFFHVHLKLDLS